MKSLYSFVSRVQTASNVKLSESLATDPTENLLKKFILRTAGVVALFLFLGGSVWGQVTQTVTTTGAGSFNVPAGVTSVSVTVIGGGGGGGRANTGIGAGGGGGGSYSSKTFTGLTGGTSVIYYNVGIAGSNNTANNGSGSSGGDSWANTTNATPTTSSGALAKGGSGGTGGTSTTTSGTGGAGGILGFGDVTKVGGNGANGSSGANAGAGGGGAGYASQISAPSAIGATGGVGSGNSGNGGNGGNGGSSTPTTTATAGSIYGGGGGASYGRNNGAAGAQGVVIITYTLPACSGTPSPGNTLASVNPVVSGSSTILSLQNATSGSGVTYQWQTSANNSTWADISGATSATYTATPTAATYYRCNVTCSGSTGNSASLLVNLTYCTPSNSGTTYYITGFSTTNGITSITNTGTSFGLNSTGYSNYSSTQSCSQYAGNTVNFSLSLAGNSVSNTYSYGVALWVDWNNNFIFETSERMYNSAAYIYSVSSSFIVPITAMPGSYRMRLMADYSATSPVACSFSGGGECEDYTFTVVALPACTTPTSLAATVTSSAQTNTTISGAFTAATTAPSGYVVVRTTANTQPTLTNGTTYTVGVSGSNYIEYVGASAGSWTSTGLTAGTTYYYWVFSYNNTACSGGPAYSASASTLTQATSSCTGATLAGLTYSAASPIYCSTVAIATNSATLGTTSGTITYSVSPTLPTGLSLSLSTGNITGTPTATSSATSYTVTANNGCTTTTASLSITVVTALSGLTYTSAAPTAYCVGTAISSNLVTAITGGGTITYSVSPALPSGLTLNISTGEISGTPAAIATSAPYTVTATNGSCSTTRSITIIVNNNLSSSTLTYTSQNVTSCRNTAISANSATLNPSSNNGTVTYSVSPALPTGLSLNLSTGAITGTPTVSQTAASYTITATSACGGSTTSVVTITVNTPATVVAPSASAICSGGSGVSLTASGLSTYSWTPTTGLSLSNAATVTANPTAATTYTISGTDVNGCTATTGTVTVTVNQTPTAITLTQTPSSVCSGSVATLNSTGGAYATNRFTDLMNALSSNFTTSAVGTGTPSAALNTTYFAEGIGSVLFNTVSTSANVAYSLNSNVNLLGFSSAQLNFSHICATEAGWDYGYVEYSSDGGATWNTFPTSSYAGTGTLKNSVVSFDKSSYTDWGNAITSSTSTPTNALWKTETINIPVAALTSQFRIRFRYTTDSSTNYYGWLIDNVNVSATSPQVVWSPTTNLYTNAGATTAYTGGSATTVYAVNTTSTQYTATSTNGSCSTSTSINTSVNPLPTITLGTASAVCAGGTTSSLSFSATTGSPNQYVIDFDATANAAGFVDVTSYTAFSVSPITLSIPSGAAAGTYNGTITVKNSTTGCIGSATSFTVTVNAPVSITAQPNNSVSLEGADATFSVTASGTGLTYQWQVSTDNGATWNNASGTSTNSSYTASSITASMAGYQYRCIVTGTAPCGSVTSSVATLTISTTAITSQPASATICSNGSNTFTISTSGSTPTYQWQVSTDAGVSYTDISGEATSSLTVSGLTAANSGNRYRCVLSGSINSDAAVLTVYDAVAIGTQPVSQIVCSNAASASFSVSATGSNLTYQWQVSTNGGSSWSNASGTSTASTYTISTVTNALNLNQYRAVVSGSSPCAAVTSNAATLNVIGVSLAASSASICMNGSFTLTATPTSGSPTLSYSWICATSGSGATTANTSNPATITPTAVGSYTYTLTTTGGGCTLTSTTAVTVNANPSITSATASPSSICAGSNVSLSASYSTSSNFSSSRIAPTNIANTTPLNYGLVFNVTTAFTLNSVDVFNGTTSSGTFVIQLQNSAGTVLQTSSTFTAPAGTGVIGTTIPFTANLGWNIPVGTGYRLLVTSGTASLVRESSLGGFPYSIGSVGSITSGYISGTTTTYYYFYNWSVTSTVDQTSLYSWSWNTTPAVTTATGTTTASNSTSSPTSQTYTVTATNPTTGCTSTSTTSAITVNPTPATPTANSTSVCGTQNATCSVTGSGISGNTFKWYTVATGGTPILGQSLSSLSAYSVSTTTIFYVSESNATCESGRVAVTQTVTAPPAVSASATSATICAGQSTTLSTSSLNSGYSYSWSNSAGSGTSVSISPTSTTTYTVSATDVSGGASNGCTSTATVTVTVNPVPTSVTATVGTGTICNGSSVDLSSTSLSNSSNQVLLSSAGDGGFENGTTFATNNWSTAGTGNNLWYVGTAAVNAGSRAAYISTNSSLGVAATYNKTTSRVSHLYRDVTFPVGATNINLSFNWQGVGESTYDYTAVYLVPAGTTPTAAVALTAGQIGSNLNGQSTWQSASFALSNNVAGTTQRLVFSWINDGSSGTDPSGVIDNVSITYSPASVYSWASSPAGFTSSTQNPTGVAPTQTTTYTVTATNSYNCSSTANTTVTVNQPSVAPTGISGTTSICIAQSTTLTATGGTLGTGANYQWGTGSTVGSNVIAGETSASITVTPSTNTTYWVRITNGTAPCAATTSGVSSLVTVINPATPVVTATDNCNGTSTLSTTATGTLLWSNSETTSPITVATAGTFTVTQTVNGCTSASGSVVAAPKTTPVTPSVSVTNDCGLSTLAFTPAANATILWSNNATTSSTTTANTETLTVVQTVNGCPSSAGSGSAVPLVIPSAPTATASQNFCVTDNATVGSLAYTSVAGNTYTWYDAAAAGNTVATSTQLPTATTTYYLSVSGSNGCTSLTRTLVAATESAQALATVSITGTTVCAGGEILFTATPVNGGLSPTYQWYNGGVPISGATSETYSATGLAEGAVITVKMIPSGSCVTVCPN